MWEPQSWVALLLGLGFIIFLLSSLVVRLLHPDYAPLDGTVNAWKDVIMTLLGGLLAWIGGQPRKKDGDDK